MIQIQLLLLLEQPEPLPQKRDNRIKIQIREQQSLPLPLLRPKKLDPQLLEQLLLHPLSQPHPQEVLQLLYKSLIVEPPKGFLFTLYLM